MCAITGFLGKSDKKTPQMLHTLALLGEERGDDSFGIALYQEPRRSPQYGGYLLKDVGGGGVFFRDNKVKTWFDEGKDTICMLHNRWATTGAITPENAHPFREGKWLYTHNGMISNFTTLQTDNKTKYQVDSQIIGFLLDKYEDKKKIFGKKLVGSFVVPYINTEKPFELYIMVHSNPVSIAINKSKTQMFYASVGKYLEGMIALNDVSDDEYEIIKLSDDHLYLFDYVNGKINITSSRVKMRQIVQKPLYNNYGGYYDSGYYDKLFPPTKKNHTAEETIVDKYDNDVSIYDYLDESDLDDEDIDALVDQASKSLHGMTDEEIAVLTK